jgi:hypothetical protein
MRLISRSSSVFLAASGDDLFRLAAKRVGVVAENVLEQVVVADLVALEALLLEQVV